MAYNLTQLIFAARKPQEYFWVTGKSNFFSFCCVTHLYCINNFSSPASAHPINK